MSQVREENARPHSIIFLSCRNTILMGLFAVFGVTFSHQGLAQTPIPLSLDKSIRQFVSSHPTMTGLKVDIEYIDSKIKLPSCSGPIDVALPARVRPWGRVNLQLRCQAGKGWFLTLPIKVLVYGEYVLTTRFIQAGAKILPSDLRVIDGDLSSLPDDVVRSINEVSGRQAVRAIQTGGFISLNNLKEPSVVKVGDRVRVQVIGTGFQAAGEGIAQSAGSINEIIKLKMPDGQVLQGKITSPGAVEINVN